MNMLLTLDQYLDTAAANDARANHKATVHHRSRTVPIPSTVTAVPNYPSKLVIYKIAASQYWQMRCYMAGSTHKASARTTNQRVALNAAREFYELLCSRNMSTTPNDHKPTATVKPHMTFAAVCAQMYRDESARVERGEFKRGSLQVLRNRLDSHILPRFGTQHIAAVDYNSILAFAHQLSSQFSSTTVSQYMVAVRKVMVHAQRCGYVDSAPEMPRIKVVNAPRTAFTPTEYWQIVRGARAMIGQQHTLSTQHLRLHYQVMRPDTRMPQDMAWVIAFMVNSFIRPSDLKTLKHRHVEVVRNDNTYLLLNLPKTKSHSRPIVTLQPAVRIYQQLSQHYAQKNLAAPDNYLFLPHLRDRAYAHWVLAFYFNWVLAKTGLKLGAHGQERSLYSLRHSSITFRLLYGQGIDLLTLARNARTSVDMINQHYASTVTGEQNIVMLQSRRTRQHTASITS
jgi:integrase